MEESFGGYIRHKRETILKECGGFSLRKVAALINIQPSYLSKVERDEVSPPSEATIIRLAKVLGEDPDVLLALAGKVSADLRYAIMKRPKLFAELIRQLRDAPDDTFRCIKQEIRDGKWRVVDRNIPSE